MVVCFLPSLDGYELGKALEHLAGHEIDVLAVDRQASGYQITAAQLPPAELLAHIGLEAV